VIAVAAAASGTIPSIPTDPWRYNPHPEAWLIVVASAAAYWYAMTRIGPTVVGRGEKVVTRGQVACFASGLAVLYAASSWPIHDWAEDYLFSVHMFEHLLISLVAPPLLLLGIPGWLTRWILRPKWAAGSIRVLARPLVAAVLFNVVVAVSHAPFWVDATLYHHVLHFWSHLLLFGVSMLMWFPVVNTLPEFPRLSRPLKMIYLFLQSIIPNVPVAFLTLSTGVVYSYYAHVPRPFGWTAIGDQQAAGAVMKVGGTFLIWGVIVVVFFRWYAEQAQRDAASRKAARLAAGRLARQPSTAAGATRLQPASVAVDGAVDDPGAGGQGMPDVLTWEHVADELARTPPAQPGP
jgi:putative membrane protein